MNKLTILVVDDEELLRSLFTERLMENGYAVDAAASGSEAIALIKEKSFDVVVTDLKMPGTKDGLDVLESAKEESPETDVIIMTAYASVDTAIDAMRKGAADYLCKPFEFDELTLRLEKIAQNRELTQTLLSVEHNKETGMLHLKDIAVKLHKKCQRVENLLKREDMSLEDRVRKALKVLSK